jgi:hypothetical protein
MYGNWQLYPCGPQYYGGWIPVPIRCEPVMPCPPVQCSEVVLPRELAVDEVTSSREEIVGGHSDARFTIEYLIEAGAAAPAVEVELASAGASSTWNATDVSAGYHTQEAFLTAAPGTHVTLTVTDAIARLRWCERICC